MLLFCKKGYTLYNVLIMLFYIQDIDECDRYSPCQHNGTCINNQGSYSCYCKKGWEGVHCERGNEIHHFQLYIKVFKTFYSIVLQFFKFNLKFQFQTWTNACLTLVTIMELASTKMVHIIATAPTAGKTRTAMTVRILFSFVIDIYLFSSSVIMIRPS